MSKSAVYGGIGVVVTIRTGGERMESGLTAWEESSIVMKNQL